MPFVGPPKRWGEGASATVDFDRALSMSTDPDEISSIKETEGVISGSER